MTDNFDTNLSKAHAPRWRERLFDGRWILLVTTLALLFFVLLGDISLTQAVVSLFIIFFIALFVPRNAGLLSPTLDTAAMMRQLREQAAIRFADTLSDPCFILDRRAVIVHQNSVAKDEFPGATIGNPIAFSMRNPTLLAAIESVRSNGQVQMAEIHQTIPNETWFQITVSPLKLADEQDMSESADWIVVSMHNLTEQKRVEGMRADFVANASHELRTPLTSLIGFIDTLQGPAAKDEEARERFLGIMRSQAERMSNLIDDLLSLSRIELRQHVRPTTSVSLSLILTEVCEGLQTQASEAEVVLSISGPDEPVSVTGDREELYEVFENLVDNAIKYGSAGKVVDVGLAEASHRPGFSYVVNIVDHGDGIAEEHVPRLTERFYRVDAESSRKKKGTGLGLAIVKHILNRHGGQMSIRSEVGVGTSVEILLPK